MANSVRHQIMDAVTAALEGITVANGYQTEVKYVSEGMEDYEQISKSKLPAVFPIDADEKRTWATIAGDSADDLEGELMLVVSCYVYDRQNVTRQQRTDLMRDVEKALMNNTAIDALILYMEPDKIVTDRGTIPNFSIWDQSYKLTYRYQHTNGG